MAWDPSRKLLKFVELRQGGNLEEPAKFDMSQSSLPIPPFHYVVRVEVINLLHPSRQEIYWEIFGGADTGLSPAARVPMLSVFSRKRRNVRERDHLRVFESRRVDHNLTCG